ncbi:hypothetical protein J6590_038882 [Homalodisca vitripennis]|nr:hypothetical protein J6590_038882 [Homalodisca vitripennis]
MTLISIVVGKFLVTAEDQPGWLRSTTAARPYPVPSGRHLEFCAGRDAVVHHFLVCTVPHRPDHCLQVSSFKASAISCGANAAIYFDFERV